METEMVQQQEEPKIDGLLAELMKALILTPTFTTARWNRCRQVPVNARDSVPQDWIMFTNLN